jgi:O-antigen/teichoic acid export membrane protein
LRMDQISRSAFSRVAASSVPMFLFQIGALLVNQLVNLVIARTATLALVTDYNVVLRLYIFVFAIAAGLSSPFYAAIREAHERGEARWAWKAMRYSLSVRVLATLPFAAILVAAGDLLVSWWIGASIARPIGTWGWACVSLCLLLSAISSLLSEVLQSLDDIWAQVGIVFLSAATVLGLLGVLIPGLGVPGVFLAMAASTIFPLGWSYRRLKTRFERA